MASHAPKDRRTRIEQLEAELEEAQQALEAIRTGQVDSLVIEGPTGPCIFSLEWATFSYRVLVETMSEGAVTMGEDGVVLYCNARFAKMLQAPLERVMGSPLRHWIPMRWQTTLESVLRAARGEDARAALCLLTQEGLEVWIHLSAHATNDDGRLVYCLVATDLAALRRNEPIGSAEAIVVCDHSGRVVEATKAAVELAADNPLLLPFETAFPIVLTTTGTADCNQGLPARAMRGEVVRAIPASLIGGDGTWVELLVSATRLDGIGDRGCGCVVTLTTVTESRRSAVVGASSAT